MALAGILRLVRGFVDVDFGVLLLDEERFSVASILTDKVLCHFMGKETQVFCSKMIQRQSRKCVLKAIIIIFRLQILFTIFLNGPSPTYF